MMNVTHNEASRRLIRRALGQCHALCHWPALALDVLAGACQLGHYRKNQPILEGNRTCRDVLVLASGSVEVGGVNAGGARFVLSLHGAGDIIGLARLLPERQFVFDYHARAATVLVRVPAQALHSVLDAHPLLWRELFFLVLGRMHDVIATQQQHAFTALSQRLADVLLRLVQTHGQPGGGSGIDIAVSQSDLAAMVGTSRQTVNQQLRRLQASGCLHTAWGRVTVLNKEALARVVNQG